MSGRRDRMRARCRNGSGVGVDCSVRATWAWRALAIGLLLSMTLACREEERRAAPAAEPTAAGESTGETPEAPEDPIVTTPEVPPKPTEPPAPTARPDEVPEAPADDVPAPEAPAEGEPPPDVPEARAPDGDDEEPSPAEPTLSLDELEHELRKTRALGFLTRLALKNDIDDLLDAVRAFHENGDGHLDLLRERFDLLVLKVMSLLQDDDPELAHRIADAREALWRLLADPMEFAKIST